MGSATERPLRFTVVTLFPESFQSLLGTSLLGKAIANGLVAVDFVDPRDFSGDRHRTVDDTPFGGGEGMVLKVDPFVAAMESVPTERPGVTPRRVLLTPQGAPLSQGVLRRLATEPQIVLVCGRYEGFDERVRTFVHDEISLGDFVLNGGEVAAMAIIDGVTRLLPGAIGNPASLETESHAEGLLEHPHYTRPQEFRGQQVPSVLLSGDHQRIENWRRMQMLLRTQKRRPDLWARYRPSANELRLLDGQVGRDAAARQKAARTYIALLHHPVYDRGGRVVTTALTNLDLHDIARSARTYGLAGYFVVTPLTSQQELASRIMSHWQEGHGARANARRSEALALIEVASDVEEVIKTIERKEGARPLTLATSAVARPGQIGWHEAWPWLDRGPLLLLLGTGWGLAQAVLEAADLALAPILGPTDYNHLSVRSAAAIVLDRFFGMRDEQGSGGREAD